MAEENSNEDIMLTEDSIPPEEAPAEDLLSDEAPPESVPEENVLPEENAAQEDLSEAPPEKHRRGKALLRIAGRVFTSLLITAAAVVLVVNFAFPVVKIYGSSMGSTLVAGDVVIAQKTTKLQQGDICAFNYGSNVLCKRVIGLEGDIIEISGEGEVLVNGNALEEPYLKNKNLGNCDIEFPFVVPKSSYFVLGDNRRNSVDSRSKMIGCVSEEQVVGRLIFRILPIPSLGKIE